MKLEPERSDGAAVEPTERLPLGGARARWSDVAARLTWLLLAALLGATAVGLAPAPGATAATAATTGVGAPAVPIPRGWLHTAGGRIVASNGTTVQLHAVNWFGLETATCAPHGLWTRSMGSILDQIRGFGFDTVRVPYANQCLDAGATTSSVDYGLNPSLAGRKPLQVLDALVSEAGRRGLRVVLDRHRPDTGSQSALWYTSRYSESRWIADWTMLARRYAGNPTVIGADLHNEPHGSACWGCGDRSRDWSAAATRAGNATLAANPNWLILVEGVETSRDGATSWWGGNLRDAAAHPIRLAVADRVVYSPHDYPRSVYAQPWFSAADYPGNLPGVWDRNWGFLARTGRAPVLLGEFGSRLLDPSDKRWMTALVAYLRGTGISYAYWSYNPNSGDTGGLVADDWRTPQAAKLAALRPILSSTPAPPPAPTAPTAPPTPPAPPASPAPGTPGPAPVLVGASVVWHLQSAWQGGYVAELTVTSATPRTGWRASWRDPSVTAVVNAWGMSCVPTGGVVTCTGTDWARTLLPGQPQRVGLQVVTSGPAPSAPTMTMTVP